MDSNAWAFPLRPEPTCVDVLAAGYGDAWAEIVPYKADFTYCQAQLGNNPEF